MTDRPVQKLVNAIEAFNVWLPQAPQRARALVDEAREDPGAILRSPAIRVALLVAAGLVLALIVNGLGQWIAPSAGMGESAERVPVRVRCLNAECSWSKQHRTIVMDRDYDDWPAECPSCKKRTLYPHVRCHNSKCRQWVVPRILPDGTWRCPRCGARL